MISLMYPGLYLLRRLFGRCSGREALQPPPCELDADAASAMIENLLRSGRPAMVGRFGCTEMSCLHNYLKLKNRAGTLCITSQAGETNGGGIKIS